VAKPKVCVLGAFVADLTCRTERMPKWGETILGISFKLGPGGKGSNQAVAGTRCVWRNGQKLLSGTRCEP
jgi:ribokinase